MNQPPPIPLDHRVRRRIMRRLHEDFAAHTVNELSKDLGLSLKEARYHCEVLARWGNVTECEGPDGVLVKSMAAEWPDVIAILMATQIHDKPK